jgi:hypothetical protein
MKKGREDLQPYVDSAGILGRFPPLLPSLAVFLCARGDGFCRTRRDERIAVALKCRCQAARDFGESSDHIAIGMWRATRKTVMLRTHRTPRSVA